MVKLASRDNLPTAALSLEGEVGAKELLSSA